MALGYSYNYNNAKISSNSALLNNEKVFTCVYLMKSKKILNI